MKPPTEQADPGSAVTKKKYDTLFKARPSHQIISDFGSSSGQAQPSNQSAAKNDANNPFLSSTLFKQSQPVAPSEPADAKKTNASERSSSKEPKTLPATGSV